MNIALVEDNLVQQDLLKIYIEDCGHQCIGSFNNAEEADAFLINANADLVLIDINLDGKMNGIELANNLRSKWNANIIFITSQTEVDIISKAIKNEPLDVLIKPVQFEQFQASLMLAELKSKTAKTNESSKFVIKEGFLVFKNGHLFERVILEDLIYAESMGNYFNLTFTNDKATLKGTLAEIERALPGDQFVRINRSVIVALKKIKSFNAKRVFLNNGEEFPISKNISDELMLKLIG
ncbi:MAG: response regulator transcription factor [Schleiferiaceae bacterium]|jgi:DNA-binding LytR/AlgR family response regulator|nr:response regulator transcription factor [Schleiferiaceae bacterium]